MNDNNGWVKLTDPKSGKTFYANSITKITQWDPPAGFLDEPVKKSSSSSAVSIDTDLPSNWERLHDDASGKDFYVNHMTKQTQWEHPGKQSRRGSHANSTVLSNRNIPANGQATSAGLATGFGFIPSPRNESISAPTESTNHSNAILQKPSHHSAWDTNHLPPSNTFGQGSPTKQMPTAYKSISFVSNDDQSSKYYKGVGPNSLKPIDFKVVQVSNLLRSSCPSCDTIFSISKRRHHCRLCGDIFCDHCSNKKVLLPLAGPAYEKPVRVCDSCYVDVEKGNYFSMRRYLTPLLLYNPDHEGSAESYIMADDTDDESETITIKNVAAALTSMAQDIDALLLDSSLYSEKMTIGADALVPAISKHLKSPETADRAIRALASLLSLGGIVDDTSYVTAFYMQENASSYMNDVMNLLEWSGSSIKTIAVQEQSVKVLLTLSDPKIINGILDLEESSGHNYVSILDMHRAIRSMLDHVTNTASPALQRWASACIRHLVTEDYRRAIDAISEAMVLGLKELKYKTIIGDIIKSGGSMILSSLLSSEDSDARENAISALSAIIFSSRELGTRVGVYKDAYQVSSIEVPSEVSIVESIFSFGACGSLGNLLVSADNQIAKMGCEFAKVLVSPLLTEPSGSNMIRYHRLFLSDPNSILLTTEDKMSVYRRACLELGSSDGIIGALIHLITDASTTRTSRPLELKLCSMEVLAAISLALADFDCKAKLSGGLADEKLQHQIASAFTALEDERIGDALVSVFSQTGVGSLNTSRDSIYSQLQEMSALAISALSPCSESFATSLMGKHILTPLISISLDEGFFQHSYRGEWSERRLPMFEATASLLAQSWKIMQYESLRKESSGSTNTSQYILNFLLEALDGGIIRLLTSALSSRTEMNESAACISDFRFKIAACHICASMFGVGICDSSGLGLSRIFEALGTSQKLIPQILYLLDWVGITVQSSLSNRSSTFLKTLLSHLLEAVILATGSLCGAPICSFISLEVQKDNILLATRHSNLTTQNDVFSDQFKEICRSVSDILAKLSGFITSSLVGAFGEGSVTPVLRLLGVVSVNGSSKSNQQLVRSGVVSPLCDMVKGAILNGDYYTFSVIADAVGNIGVEVSSNSEQLNSLRESVKLFSNLLAIQSYKSNSSPEILSALKHKCIITVAALSGNSSLWNTIVANFIPLFTDNYLALLDGEKYSEETLILIRAGLQTIARVVTIPSHATFIANTGLAPILSSFISEDDLYSSDYPMAEVECQAVEILCALLEQTTKQAATGEIDPGMVNLYAYDAACVILSRNKFFSVKMGSTLTRLGLRMIEHGIIFLRSIPKQDIPCSPMVLTFIDSAIRHKAFIKRLCASVFERDFSNPTLPAKDFSVHPMYGDPLLLLLDDSSKKNLFLEAVIQIIFYLIFYGSLAQTKSADDLWDIMMLSDVLAVEEDHAQKMTGIIALLCILLNVFDKKDARYASDSYYAFALPIVRSRLVYMLSIIAGEFSSVLHSRLDSIDETHQMLAYYRVPQICLELTTDASLSSVAFDALQHFFKGFPESLLSSLVSDASSLKLLLDILNKSPEESDPKVHETLFKLNVFAAAVLSSSAEYGILGPSINSLGLRNAAIASLISGCLSENEFAEELNDAGSNMSELCLRALIDVVSLKDSKSQDKSIRLSETEATLISFALGSKLSSLTLERFVHRVAGQSVPQIDDFDVKKFSEVKLLCALTVSPAALDQLCSNGGLEALSLIAAEGDITTINALTEISKTKPVAILGVDGHVSAMQVISKKKSDASCENACLQLLTYLCHTPEGLDGVCSSEEFDSCLTRTYDIVYSSIESSCKDVHQTKISPIADTLDFKREVSALKFLTAILSNKNKSVKLLSDTILKKSISTLSINAIDTSLQYASILFLRSCTRISIAIHNSAYSPDSDCSMILTIISSSQSRRSRGHIGIGITSFGDFGESRQYNENLIVATCVEILESIFDEISEDNRIDVVDSIESSWKPLLQSMTTQKKAIGRNRNAGLMMNNMMMLYSIAVKRFKTREWMAQNDGFLSDLFILITMNPMAENVSNEDDVVRKEQIYWRSSVNHALHILAYLTTFPSRNWSTVFSEIFSKIVSSRLSVVRKQEIATINDILTKFSNSSEYSSASEAIRILENIKL